MQLAGVEIGHPFVAAPMAGVSSPPFRLMAKRGGAALVYSEMISAQGLMRRRPATLKLTQLLPEERPVGLQLFGADPQVMGRAAAEVAALAPDLIDINLGCPVRKVRKQGAGSALAQDPGRAAAVVAAVVKAAAPIPVTVKLRLGFNNNELESLLPPLIQAGARAVCLHARTVKQGYQGRADWAAIAQLRSWCPLPVIGNGDAASAADAVEMLAQTSCDAVMIGRAARGDPWIFGRAADLWAGRRPRRITPAQRHRALLEHLELARRYGGERHALHFLRLFMVWYVRGLPGASAFRRQAGQSRDLAGLLELCERFFAQKERAP